MTPISPCVSRRATSGRKTRATEALNRIHRALALDAYADAHELTAKVDEMQAEVDRVAEFYPQERRNIIRTNLMRDEARQQVATSVRARKAMRSLVAEVAEGAAPLPNNDRLPSRAPARTGGCGRTGG